jgi:hypothetical protein
VSCATCKATFAAFGELTSAERATMALRLDTHEPECRCEGVSVSDHSPGPVEDAEVLVRILVAPQHIDKKTGLPKSAALTTAGTIGLSVLREDRASDDEILRLATTLVQNARSKAGKPERAKKIGVFGVLRMACSIVRNFVWIGESKTSFCVYDTAREVWPSHADAFQRIAGAPDGVPDARRNALFEHVKNGFVPVGQFRNGLLNDLAPE